jgi:pyruvate formate lyase activating enzyme
MRCKYCHNPETWAMTGGEEWTPEALLQKCLRYKPYWRGNGGITVSGGEPLLQMDFLTEFFKLAKSKGVHTTLDTAGNPFTREEPFLSRFQELMQYTDLVMLDLKQTDAAGHKALTGWDNQNILDMARWLSDHGKAMWLRRVLVPGITDDPDELRQLKAFIDSLNTVERVEILPYHTLGVFKWEKLGIDYPLEGVEPPTEEQVQAAERILGIEKG